MLSSDDNSRAVEHWTERELDEAAFKDAHLGRRFGELLKKIGDGMGGSIPFACQDWASTKAAYLARAGDPAPGNVVIWRGLSRLTDIEIGAEIGAIGNVGN